jgi:hypothetical protein
MDKGTQRFAVYCGLAFPFVFFLGFIVAGLFPLPDPEMSLEKVRDFYADDPDRMRLGLFIMVASAPLQAPLFGLIAVHMKRIEGSASVLTYTQILLAAVAILAVLIPVMMMVNLAYRPDVRDLQTIQFFHDQAWLIFVGMWSAASMQSVVIGIAVLRDRRADTIIPRWYGYFNLWVATLFIPGGLIYFFKDGPFAWNGVFAFWLPASVFGAWFIVTGLLFRKLTDEQPDEEQAATPQPEGKPAATEPATG